MEEDIKELKEALEEVSCCSYHDEMCLKAIEYINKLEKENKELKEQIKDLKDIQQQICNEELITQEYVTKNYIPKSKIEDKIKEFEETKLCGGEIHQAVVETEIRILKSFLEGK